LVQRASSKKNAGANRHSASDCKPLGLRELGYVYAIIGSAGPTDFYERTVGAIVIPDSEPGFTWTFEVIPVKD